MKKKIFALLLVALVLVFTGCAKVDQGIVINSDGSGYFYAKSLIVDTEDGEFTSTIDDDLKAQAVIQDIEEFVDGQRYVGNVAVIEFDSLERLSELGFVEVVENFDGTTTLVIKGADLNEVAEEVEMEELDEFTKSILKASLDATFTIEVDGQIVNSTGKVNELGNSVTWDIMEDLGEESVMYLVNFRKNEVSAQRNPVADGFIKPGPDYVTVVIDGKKVFFPDQRPIIESGRTLVPIRAISENLGAIVEWIPDKTVKLIKDNKVITLTIDEKEVTIQEGDKLDAITLDVPAKIVNGRTMVPLRAVSEIFDMLVDWDQATYTVIIQKKSFIARVFDFFLDIVS